MVRRKHGRRSVEDVDDYLIYLGGRRACKLDDSASWAIPTTVGTELYWTPPLFEMTPSYLLTLLAAASLTAALGDLAASVAFRDGPSEVSAAALLARGVFGSFALAFASLAWQAQALYGDGGGAAPARLTVEQLARWLEGKSASPSARPSAVTILSTRLVVAWWRLWFRLCGGGGGGGLRGAPVAARMDLPAWLGCGASLVALVAGPNLPSWLVATFLYNAYRRVGSVFLNFQWDQLLIEKPYD